MIHRLDLVDVYYSPDGYHGPLRVAVGLADPPERPRPPFDDLLLLFGNDGKLMHMRWRDSDYYRSMNLVRVTVVLAASPAATPWRRSPGPLQHDWPTGLGPIVPSQLA